MGWSDKTEGVRDLKCMFRISCHLLKSEILQHGNLSRILQKCSAEKIKVRVQDLSKRKTLVNTPGFQLIVLEAMP